MIKDFWKRWEKRLNSGAALPLLWSAGSIFSAEIDKVGTEEAIATQSGHMVLSFILPLSKCQESLPKHTNTDQTLYAAQVQDISTHGVFDIS